MRRLILFAVFSALLVGSLNAQVINPWVLSPVQPDTRTMKDLADDLYRRENATTDREKALAIWRYLLTDGRFVDAEMIYHIAGWAYEEPAGEVLDPVKLLNSYGFGLCYQFAPLLEALWEGGGFKDARCWFLSGHTVTEVYYDGRYHMLDSDMLGYTPLGDDPNSQISNVLDLEKDPSLITKRLLAPDKVNPAITPEIWYPADVRAKAMDGYASLFVTKDDDWLYPFQRFSGGHTMDYILRPGEKLVRFYEPETPGLYYLPYKRTTEGWNEFPREIERWNIKTADGPHSQKDDRRWATGYFKYSPVLSDPGSFYNGPDGVAVDNVKLPSGESGVLESQETGKVSSVVFDVSSPWVLIDGVIKLNAWLHGPSQYVLVETSTDNGVSWQTAGKLAGSYSGGWSTSAAAETVSANGTRTAVSGHYNYLVKISFADPSGKNVAPAVGDIVIKSLFEHNPRTLPQLSPGNNAFTFSPGKQSRRVELPVETLDFAAQAVRVNRLEPVDENGNEYIRPVAWKAGSVIFAIEAPEGEEIIALNAGGRFLDLDKLAPEKLTAETRPFSYAGKKPSKRSASLSWSVSMDGGWKRLWQYDPTPVQADGLKESRTLRWPEVDKSAEDIQDGTEKLYVKYDLEGMALDKIRLAVHTNPAGTADSKLMVTHVWEVNGSRREFTFSPADPSQSEKYKVETGPRLTKNVALIFTCEK